MHVAVRRFCIVSSIKLNYTRPYHLLKSVLLRVLLRFAHVGQLFAHALRLRVVRVAVRRFRVVRFYAVVDASVEIY